MARFKLKPFASTGGVTGQFGSFEANGGQVGDGVLTDDNDTIQGLPAWIDGWDAATNNALKLPRLEEMNGVQKVFSEFAIQNFEDGITYWQAGMGVTANQTVVQYDGKLYLNITGTNTNTAPNSDTTNWKYVLDLTKEYVDTTSAQNIYALKSIISTNRNTGAGFIAKNTAFDSTSTQVNDTLFNIPIYDKDNILRANIVSGVPSANITNIGMTVRDNAGTSKTYLALNYNSSTQDAFAACTTPALTATGDEVITAKWFNQKSAIPKLNLTAVVSKPTSTWRVGAGEYGVVTVALTAPSYGSTAIASLSTTTSPAHRFAACSQEGIAGGMCIVKPNDYIVIEAAGGGYCNGCSFIPFL